jgi:hypothetical protein
MGNMMSRDKTEKGEDKAEDAFKKVTDATEASFCGRTKSMFESGDKLQCEMVDAVFDVFKTSTTEPGKVMDRMADVMERSAEAIRDAAKSKSDSKESESKEEEPSSSET